MTSIARPDPREAAEYYFTYINKVPAGDIRELLSQQLPDTLALLGTISEEASQYRYAPRKWSVRQVLNHVNDAERLFAFRAFWFARGFDTPLPSFEQEVASAAAAADLRSWRDHVEEFRSVREASLTLFAALPDDSWDRRGVASGHLVTVRALAYITAGHLNHHIGVLRERYLTRP
jgi:uncharacterized damage-inducible protein DinB